MECSLKRNLPNWSRCLERRQICLNFLDNFYGTVKQFGKYSIFISHLAIKKFLHSFFSPLFFMIICHPSSTFVPFCSRSRHFSFVFVVGTQIRIGIVQRKRNSAQCKRYGKLIWFRNNFPSMHFSFGFVSEMIGVCMFR